VKAFSSRVLRGVILVGSLTLAVAESAFAEIEAPWQNWQTSFQKSEELVGKIWSTRERRFITPRLLANALKEAKFVLIGGDHPLNPA
jgi:hypothetical protein